MTDGLFAFWGKARPAAETGPRYHPLVLHSLDVAAAGRVLLDRHPRLLGTLARLLGIDTAACRDLAVFLLALHDIGKFAKGFQGKVPELYPSSLLGEPYTGGSGYDHAAGGLKFLADDFFDRLWMDLLGDCHAADPLLRAVVGHHGSPPDCASISLQREFGRVGLAHARAYVETVIAVLPPAKPKLDERRAVLGSFALAGLAVLADWIGSNEAWFPYQPPEAGADLGAYWRSACERAKRAVVEAGLIPAASVPLMDYQTLLRNEDFIPTPMQRWTLEVSLAPGANLFVIEDETGSGKTEAALMLAHRLIASGAADGLYVALPTMATANAMHGRLAEAYRRLFAPTAMPSLVLAHGARDLNDRFVRSVLAGPGGPSRYGGGGDPFDETAIASCTAWIADDRRRAFLADVGVGTIDQALLGVLPSRHQSLRLLGLMRRVLVIDEVHAYDAYMQREIETLLAFQAACGGSTILLSATLPATIKRRLFAAFAKACPGAGRPDPGAAAYPLAAQAAAGTAQVDPVAGRAGRARRVELRWLDSVAAAAERVAQMARDGAAVAWIRNSVDDAIEAFDVLAALDLDVMLFHARFALQDRLAREREVLKRFGKDSTPAQRRYKVLVATQVIEQSLDLDFDAMASDLAPVDLVIQRAGRLQRHHRPGREGPPLLHLLSPSPARDAHADWYQKLLPRAARVYQDHARLWLSAEALARAGAIESPGGIRALIEAVYGPDGEEGVPLALRESLHRITGKSAAERGMATMNLLTPSKGYSLENGPWTADIRTPTRIGDVEQVTLRLARAEEGRIDPYAAGEDPWIAWRLSEVTAARWRIARESVPPGLQAAAAHAKEGWGRYDRDKVLVVLEERDGRLVGQGLAERSKAPPITVTVTYDPDRGLSFD